jgi:hypothetical protein
MIAGLVISLVKFINDFRKESKQKGETQTLAITAIVIGFLIFIPFAGVPGLLLAVLSYYLKKMKSLSKIAIIVNLIFLTPWIAVLIFGT